MKDEQRSPREYDVVLGGNNPVFNALVLGGIERVKHRFAKAKSDEVKIAVLQDALKYGEVGEDFLSDVFLIEQGKIKWMSAVFISATNNEIYKELLVDYFANLLQNDVRQWNYWKSTITNIKICLKGVKFTTSTKLVNRDLVNVNLSNADLSYVSLSKCNLSNSDLHQANLASTNLEDAILVNVDLTQANLFGTSFQRAKLSNVNLTEASLIFANFKFASLENIKFGNNDTFGNNSLQGVSFKNSFLQYIKFAEIIFDDNWVVLNRYKQKQTNFLKSTLHKVLFDNCRANNISFSGTSFQEVIFNKCSLVNTNFSNCNHNLRFTFKHSNLENANFTYSDLREVDFDNVNLRGADFRKANLKGVDFTDLDVREANFTRCIFGNNNLERANTKGAKFNSNLKIWNLEGALFDDQYYYEPIYESSNY